MSEAKDYGEPWTTAYGTIDDRHDDTVARDAMASEAARIVTCINACAGLDIEAALAAAREAEKECRQYVTLDELGCEQDAHGLIYKLAAALSLLTPQRKETTEGGK